MNRDKKKGIRLLFWIWYSWQWCNFWWQVWSVSYLDWTYPKQVPRRFYQDPTFKQLSLQWFLLLAWYFSKLYTISNSRYPCSCPPWLIILAILEVIVCTLQYNQLRHHLLKCRRLAWWFVRDLLLCTIDPRLICQDYFSVQWMEATWERWRITFHSRPYHHTAQMPVSKSVCYFGDDNMIMQYTRISGCKSRLW